MPDNNTNTNTNNSSYVSAGKPKVGGAVFRAPLGTTVPTDATTALNEAFVCMGYISEDGVKNDISRTVEVIRAWGGDPVLETQTEKIDDFKMTFIEAMNPEVLKAVHGDTNVSGTLSTGLTVHENSKELETAAWIIEMILNGGVLKRTVIPQGKITEIEEVTYDDSNAIGYGCTISAKSDSNGNTHHEYFKEQ
ncbi:MAG: phage tail protein [Lachnospiraceae bacterium]|nr:phage tail protein [Lachnospiraceae bacterium]